MVSKSNVQGNPKSEERLMGRPPGCYYSFYYRYFITKDTPMSSQQVTVSFLYSAHRNCPRAHFFVRFAIWFWAILRKQGKDYAFEKAYLSWLINRHRYLGLLPARIVAARWGEGRRIVD